MSFLARRGVLDRAREEFLFVLFLGNKDALSKVKWPMTNGFLGAGTTLTADLNLLAQLAMGFALLFGMWLARRKRFVAHGICQASVMLLNLVAIAFVMWPAFRAQVAPVIPKHLRNAYFGVATLHAMLGSAAELLGLYILLVAGTKLIPEHLRFRNWKHWMRIELALWWIVILLGVGTYFVWHRTPAGGAQSVKSKAAAARTVIHVSNFSFSPKEVTVHAGDTVQWVGETGRHTIEADNSSFKSPTLLSGRSFERNFAQPGDFAYHCGFHGAAGGRDMAGVIHVAR
jgi:plastocyanin